jgi:hypothetical protein
LSNIVVSKHTCDFFHSVFTRLEDIKNRVHCCLPTAELLGCYLKLLLDALPLGSGERLISKAGLRVLHIIFALVVLEGSLFNVSDVMLVSEYDCAHLTELMINVNQTTSVATGCRLLVVAETFAHAYDVLHFS